MKPDEKNKLSGGSVKIAGKLTEGKILK